MSKKSKSKHDEDEKPQGFIDKLLHGDHGTASKSEEDDVSGLTERTMQGESDESEDDLPVEPKTADKPKVSPKSVEPRDQTKLKKFDKFK